MTRSINAARARSFTRRREQTAVLNNAAGLNCQPEVVGYVQSLGS